jgi:hypothetical protein
VVKVFYKRREIMRKRKLRKIIALVATFALTLGMLGASEIPEREEECRIQREIRQINEIQEAMSSLADTIQSEGRLSTHETCRITELQELVTVLADEWVAYSESSLNLNRSADLGAQHFYYYCEFTTDGLFPRMREFVDLLAVAERIQSEKRN